MNRPRTPRAHQPANSHRLMPGIETFANRKWPPMTRIASAGRMNHGFRPKPARATETATTAASTISSQESVTSAKRRVITNSEFDPLHPVVLRVDHVDPSFAVHD